MRFFFEEEGGKRTLRKKNVSLVLFPIVVFGTCFSLLRRNNDTSFIEASSSRLSKEPNKENVSTDKSTVTVVLKRQDSSSSAAYAGHIQSEGSRINFKAPQVIQRKGTDSGKTLPIGTSFIGKLLTGIDTRESNAFVRVLIPYGASFDHDRRIEKNSILIGNTSYTGSGEKVYVSFNRILFPDGSEFHIEAQALNSADYTPGLYGEEHDGAGGRVATAVGLNMLSGMSNVLVERESLSQFAEPTAKSNLKNGFFNGLTKATQDEAQRRASKMNDTKDYVLIEAGSDIIVSLTETFNGEPI